MTNLLPDWKWATLGEISLSVKNGVFVSRPGTEPDGVPILRIGAVRPMNLDLSDLRYSGLKEDFLQSKDALVNEGDLLFTRYNGNPNFVGVAAPAPARSGSLTYPDKLIRVRLHRNIAFPSYIAYACASPVVREQIDGQLRTTAGQVGISGGSLKALRIPLPPLAEQRRIAEILDQAGSLRSRRWEAIGRLDELAQSIFIDMFGEGSPKNPRWESVKLGEVTAEFRYGTSEKSATSGYPALRIPNIVGGELDLREIKLVPATTAEFDRLRLIDGDLLFVRTNGNPDYVGRCAVFTRDAVATSIHTPTDFIYASYLIRARLHIDRVNPIFACHFMRGPVGRKALRERSKTSAGQFNINTQGLGSMEIPIPPMSLQNQFAELADGVEKIKIRHMAHLRELENLFASLQHRAFRGEL